MTPSRRRASAAVLTAIALGGCSTTGTGTPGQSARGQELYQSNCMACHGGQTGGDIADIPPRHNAEGHTWHHPDCLLIDIVREGTSRRPGLPDDAPTMPPFADELSDQDIHAILAYITTWWTQEQREFQQQATEQTCD